MKNIYLIFSIIGAIIPFLFFINVFTIEGLNITLFLPYFFASTTSGGITVDLLISSIIFWVFMFHQLRKPRNPKPYLFIILNLVVGLSCALPAYFYAREHKSSHDK